jgi:hypothetical protein
MDGHTHMRIHPVFRGSSVRKDTTIPSGIVASQKLRIWWQVQQTWPKVGLVLAFGLLMTLRKDLYLLIAFHFLVNMWMVYGPG